MPHNYEHRQPLGDNSVRISLLLEENPIVLGLRYKPIVPYRLHNQIPVQSTAVIFTGRRTYNTCLCSVFFQFLVVVFQILAFLILFHIKQNEHDSDDRHYAKRDCHILTPLYSLSLSLINVPSRIM